VNWTGKKVLVLGLGDTGLSMANWLARHGALVSVADSRTEPPGKRDLARRLPAATVHLGGFRDSLFDGLDLIAISPGVRTSEPAVARAASLGVSVAGDIELFAQALTEGPRARIAAITGTNGKTTVTSLAGAMCRAAGLDCEVAGNIGPAVLDALARREQLGRLPQAWVLELSSFQLETTQSLAADVATVLNLSEDHLDRYSGFDDYVAAKARIFHGEGVQVLNRDDARSLAMARAGRTVVTFGLQAPENAVDFGLVRVNGDLWFAQGETALAPVSDMRLAGLHNAANALAALALCGALGLPMAPLLAALREFKGLAHRGEFVREARGVRYYDDSKGTNVGSTVAALAGFAGVGGKVVLIAGGDGKGQDFAPLAGAVERAARCVVLIGRDAPAIQQAISGRSVEMRRAASLEEAVEIAADAALSGDAVLLSPACASFDMFRDYRHRGEVFREAVQRISDDRAH
jgi:UDP-N-acetylmuramoylalanine--D-glutamate ligase